MIQDYSKFMDVASQAALAAGKIVLAQFRTKHHRTLKSDSTIVTHVDLAAEKKIISIIKKNFPDHDFLGEEFGQQTNSNEYQWLIDPIDGTTNYTFGIPFFACGVGLKRQDQMVAAAVYLPYFNELLTAYKNGGAFLNGQAIKMAKPPILRQAIVGFSGGRSQQEVKALKLLRKKLEGHYATGRSLGSALAQHAYLALGRIHVIANIHRNLWDIAAGSLIAKEVGAQALTFKGEQWHIGTPDLILAHPNLTKAIKRLL